VVCAAIAQSGPGYRIVKPIPDAGAIVGKIKKALGVHGNSNEEGTITVIHQDSPDKYSVVESVKTLPWAKTMALYPKTHQLFLSTAEAGHFEVLVVGR
jgi:hypothetical protein